MNEETILNKLRAILPNLEVSRLLSLLEARDQTLLDPSKSEDEKAEARQLRRQILARLEEIAQS